MECRGIARKGMRCLIAAGFGQDLTHRFPIANMSEHGSAASAKALLGFWEVEGLSQWTAAARGIDKALGFDRRGALIRYSL